MVRNMSVLQTSLEWQAWHDALTRLLNRGALFEQAMAVASDCQRSGRPLAVIQLDLDHFKHINDRYGHQAGDRVLSMVASTLSSAVRQGDLLGRVGGEEFLYRDAEYHPAGSSGGGGAIAPAYRGDGKSFCITT